MTNYGFIKKENQKNHLFLYCLCVLLLILFSLVCILFILDGTKCISWLLYNCVCILGLLGFSGCLFCWRINFTFPAPCCYCTFFWYFLYSLLMKSNHSKKKKNAIPGSSKQTKIEVGPKLDLGPIDIHFSDGIQLQNGLPVSNLGMSMDL